MDKPTYSALYISRLLCLLMFGQTLPSWSNMCPTEYKNLQSFLALQHHGNKTDPGLPASKIFPLCFGSSRMSYDIIIDIVSVISPQCCWSQNCTAPLPQKVPLCIITQSYSLAGQFSGPKSDEQTGVCLPALASRIHFMSPQTVLCFFWWLCGAGCLTVALWGGLAWTKHWCQLGEAILVPVCSVISQTNQTPSAKNALAPTCVLRDPSVARGACCVWPPCQPFAVLLLQSVVSLDDRPFRSPLWGL